MKKLRLLFSALALLLCGTSLLAHDFAVDGIYYQITSSADLAVKVSYKGSSSDDYSNEYSGSVAIPETVTYNGNTYSVTSIGSSAFYNCDRLTSVTIPNSVESIGNYAFSSCSGLTSVTIGNSVANIGELAFYGCSGLTSVTIPNSVTSIGFSAFYGCSGLKSLTIGTGMLSIGSNQCMPKKVIWLTNTPPDGYKNIRGTVNYTANDQYTDLNNVKAYPYLSSMFEVGGVKYVPVSPAERTCYAIDCAYDSTAMNINIGETVSFKGVAMKVKEVNPYALYGNNYIKGVKISNNGNIGESAFEGSMTSGNAVLKVSNKGIIGAKAFYGCKGIADATISNEGNIGESAFNGCTSLKTATLGDKVTSLGAYAFSGCSSLQGFVIPNSVESIGAYAFSGCSAMKSVKMGTGVTKIDNYTFQDCSALTDMNIASNVKTIGTYVFSGCSALQEIVIPQATTSIGNYTFSGCHSLADVIIKDRTETLSLGSNGSSPLFASCPLDSVYIGGKITYGTSSSKGHSPFYRNTSLRTVVITDKETEIYANEFYGCTNLKNMSIGNGVTAIGNYAFSGCANLESFAFGSSMSTIGEEAFSDCVSMTKLISNALVPPTCGTQALDDINKWDCTLMIPEGTLSAYQAADQWKEFFFIEDIPAAINGVVVDGDDADKNAPVYNLQGMKMQNADNLPKGVYIKGGKKYLVK